MQVQRLLAGFDGNHANIEGLGGVLQGAAANRAGEENAAVGRLANRLNHRLAALLLGGKNGLAQLERAADAA